jgi:toxin ParE1/3/4
VPSIVLTGKAESDLDAIHEYYHDLIGFSAANDVIANLLGLFGQLELFPGSGRASVMPDIRELVITQYPFIAPYRLMQGQIQVLRVLHQRAERAQDW